MKLYKKQLSKAYEAMNNAKDISTTMYWFGIASKVQNMINNLIK